VAILIVLSDQDDRFNVSHDLRELYSSEISSILVNCFFQG